MKTVVLLITLLTSNSTFAEPVSGKIDLGPVARYVASPKFGKLLQEATEFANGWKIRMDYTTDRASRTTRESIRVTVVGQQGEQYQKATFQLNGNNGGWKIDGGQVEKSAISQDEFVQFEE